MGIQWGATRDDTEMSIKPRRHIVGMATISAKKQGSSYK